MPYSTPVCACLQLGMQQEEYRGALYDVLLAAAGDANWYDADDSDDNDDDNDSDYDNDDVDNDEE